MRYNSFGLSWGFFWGGDGRSGMGGVGRREVEDKTQSLNHAFHFYTNPVRRLTRTPEKNQSCPSNNEKIIYCKSKNFSSTSCHWTSKTNSSSWKAMANIISRKVDLKVHCTKFLNGRETVGSLYIEC